MNVCGCGVKKYLSNKKVHQRTLEANRINYLKNYNKKGWHAQQWTQQLRFEPASYQNTIHKMPPSSLHIKCLQAPGTKKRVLKKNLLHKQKACLPHQIMFCYMNISPQCKVPPGPLSNKEILSTMSSMFLPMF